MLCRRNGQKKGARYRQKHSRAWCRFTPFFSRILPFSPRLGKLFQTIWICMKSSTVVIHVIRVDWIRFWAAFSTKSARKYWGRFQCSLHTSYVISTLRFAIKIKVGMKVFWSHTCILTRAYTLLHIQFISCINRLSFLRLIILQISQLFSTDISFNNNNTTLYNVYVNVTVLKLHRQCSVID